RRRAAGRGPRQRRPGRADLDADGASAGRGSRVGDVRGLQRAGAAGGRVMDERALRWLLLGAIGSVGLIFAAVFVAGLRRRASEESGDRIRPSGVELATGFVTVFFDTLGIGSFATTTAIFRGMRLAPDHLIPRAPNT